MTMALFTGDYNRERQRPSVDDPLYLHLQDLLSALEPRLEKTEGVWLDYGSGTSPYGPYSSAKLLVADVAGELAGEDGPPIDFELVPRQPCPAGDESFDGILSTQVLEHVDDPRFYLEDALRMMRPGGRLLLTTHGTYEDHPCPLDLWRWTVQGLRQLLDEVGFEVDECLPVTCGPRATLFLMLRFLPRATLPMPVAEARSVMASAVALRSLQWLMRRGARGLNRYGDLAFSDRRLGREEDASIYVAILAAARKPAR